MIHTLIILFYSKNYQITECEALEIKNAAQVSPGGPVKEGTEVTVTCLLGHSLNGPVVVSCATGGIWSEEIPQCGKL